MGFKADERHVNAFIDCTGFVADFPERLAPDGGVEHVDVDLAKLLQRAGGAVRPDAVLLIFQWKGGKRVSRFCLSKHGVHTCFTRLDVLLEGRALAGDAEAGEGDGHQGDQAVDRVHLHLFQGMG
jgi:hypothetical protein